MTVRLHHHIDGKKDRPWLVMINGLFADLKSWDEGVKYLNKHFRILRYDGRGQGQGPRPPKGYGLEILVDDLCHLLNTLKIHKAFLIGLSNGGRIALEYATRYPQKTSAVIAADTYDRPSYLLQLKLQSWLKAQRVAGAQHRFDVTTPWIWGESTLEHRPELVAIYRAKAELEKSHVIEELIKGALEDHVIDLAKIICPTLFCVGLEDLLTPPHNHKLMQKKVAGSELAILPGGHASLLEYPQSLKEVCLPWLLKHGEQTNTRGLYGMG